MGEVGEEYKCAECGGVFKRPVPDTLANEEAKIDFPSSIDEEMVLICDDCYKQFMNIFASRN
jgi:DNA-directed RNA polymerase subunit RPC12/RpoP